MKRRRKVRDDGEEFEAKAIDTALRRDLGAFLAKVVLTLKPGHKYKDNWHVDAMIEALRQVEAGEVKRLTVSLPPRSLKTTTISIAYVAWILGHKPHLRVICASYSLGLATNIALEFRRIVMSDWYKRVFPWVRWTKDTENECFTAQGGGRYAVSVHGSLTGRGGDLLIVDDVLKTDDANSELARKDAIDWFQNTLLSRLDDPRSGAIIVVGQRLHEADLIGTLRKEGGWQHLKLPAIAVIDEDVPIGPGRSYHRKAGELLHEGRDLREDLEKIRSRPHIFAAQYQQDPLPALGNMIKAEWIQYYDEPPDRGDGTLVVQSWDTASTENGNWSACTTWLKKGRQYYLLDVWRGRLEFPAVARKVVALALLHRPNRLLIEDAGPGLHLVQQLRASPPAGVPVPLGIKPSGSKRDRMEHAAGCFDSKQVHLPKKAGWLVDFLHELLGFPSSQNDDQVDSVSQFLNWAELHYREPPKYYFSPPQVIEG